MRNLIWGFAQYFNGLKFSLSEKRLRMQLFILCDINVIVFFLIIFGLLSHLDTFLHGHIPLTGEMLQKIYYYLAYGLAVIATFIISAVLVYFFSNILVGAFYGDVLSKKYFEIQNFKYPSINRSFVENLKHIGEKFLKIFVVLFLTVFSFFLALLPGLGLMGVFLSALVLSFDMMDYGFDVMGLTIKDRFAFFRSHFLTLVGFSLGLMMIMAIPLINVLFIPSSIVAASHLLVGIKKGRT